MLDEFIIILLLFIWRMIPVVISVLIASKRGRNEMLWAFLGLFFGWISVLIIACLSGLKQKKSDNNLEELTKLKDLLDSGAITQEEFEAKKKQILGL